jgi:endonuclease YncB( thermonuclease family)
MSQHTCIVSCLILMIASLVVNAPATSAQAAPPPTLPPGDDAKVTRIVSGDTIEVVIQGIGFAIGYYGVQAPKIATAQSKADCYAAQSLAYNRQLVAGMTVRVERDQTDFEPSGSGRLMRYVYLPNGLMLNELLLQTGHALLADSTTDQRYQSRLVAAQQAAQVAKAGLWSSCPGVTLPTPLPAAAATPSPEQCVYMDYESLAERGPRPAVLDNLLEGACVMLQVEKQTRRYTWHPAGSLVHLDRSMFIRWKDALVPLTLQPDGRLTALDCSDGWDIRFNVPMREWYDKELVHAGDRGDILMLPSSRSFVFQQANNGEYIALVDVLQLAEGTFVRREPQQAGRYNRCHP